VEQVRRQEDTDSAGVLGLLQLGHRLDIEGDVLVTVEEVCDLGDWVTSLVDPTVLVWRDSEAGDRHLHISARHDRPPVRGVITVSWRTAIRHTFWSTLLHGEDLARGTERDLRPHEVLTALTRTRMSTAHEP